MLDYLHNNVLALYGALVGTVALFLNFVKLRHDVLTRNVRLKVSYRKSPSYEASLRALSKPPTDKPWSGDGPPNLAVVYLVEVVNVGSVDAFIKTCGIETTSGQQKEALAYSAPNSLILQSISQMNGLSISSKGAKSFSVYLRKGEEPFEPAHAYVEDQTGKRWKSRRTSILR